FGISHDVALIFVGLAMIIVAIYSSLSGLLGVAITDFIQFFMAMLGTTILAFIVVNSPEIGGIEGLKAKLPPSTLNFFPRVGNISSTSDFAGVFTLSIGTFLAYITMQWWASWYPGSDPGGGGYIAQRMMSTKNEQHAIAATMLFQIFHYCIRPWPWIVVGLCVIVLYPELSAENKKIGYVMAMRDYLPSGLKGLVITAFFAAYMSCVSSQLNWGASYLVNDLYKRFMEKNAGEKRLVLISRIATFLMMGIALMVTPHIHSISDVWEFMIECGAGLGLVLILRWYWWRINAWSEITALFVPFIVYAISRFYLHWVFPNTFFLTLSITTVSWIMVTYITQPTDLKVLQKFYERINPAGSWRPVRESLGLTKPADKGIAALVICWLSSITMTYGFLFFIGYAIFREWNNAFVMLSVISGSFVILSYQSRKNKIFYD
ncbi:MAG TPA: hypothetical protein VNW99_09925, partial [Cytophagaceae bacterium]|nr:hypothetical protein [Cytophagaceae bacterium]